MTPEERVLGELVVILEGLSIPYMVTGSIATSYHGRPRATHDADIVIDPTLQQLEALVHELRTARFYVDDESATRALARRSQFNAIEMVRAVKLDLIIRKERPFSEEEFRRRQRVELPLGRFVDMVTAEDAVLSKLEWARRSGDSERQLRDASSVLELNPGIDRNYIERWARDLKVADLWQRIATAGE